MAEVDSNALWNSKTMLSGKRYDVDTNKAYAMPEEVWDTVKFSKSTMPETIKYFVGLHYKDQLPRILELERYYRGDNRIHYANTNKSPGRADNRIASGFVSTIVDFQVGYSVGNPPKYQYDDDQDVDDELMTAVNDFNKQVDEGYHDKRMKHFTSLVGRAYELMYCEVGTNNVMLKALDPANVFIVYNTDINPKALFAVYYYLVEYKGKKVYYINVYTDTQQFKFTSEGSPMGNYIPGEVTVHFFKQVPVIEFLNNEERIGTAEPKLDQIDAVDLSLSEMANSQEDFANATLQIDGGLDDEDEDLDDEDERQGYQHAGDGPNVPDMIKDRVLQTTPMKVTQADGNVTFYPTTVQYITKELDVEAWKKYLDELTNEIHKDTNTPNISDENFDVNSSGVAMTWKLLGTDQQRVGVETLFRRGIMQRLRMLVNYYATIGKVSHPENVNNIAISFVPNLPKNDAEVVSVLQALTTTGEFSQQTIHEYAKPVTGISAEAEEQRLKDESDPDEIPKVADLYKQVADKGTGDQDEDADKPTNS